MKKFLKVFMLSSLYIVIKMIAYLTIFTLTTKTNYIFGHHRLVDS